MRVPPTVMAVQAPRAIATRRDEASHTRPQKGEETTVARLAAMMKRARLLAST